MFCTTLWIKTRVPNTMRQTVECKILRDSKIQNPQAHMTRWRSQHRMKAHDKYFDDNGGRCFLCARLVLYYSSPTFIIHNRKKTILYFFLSLLSSDKVMLFLWVNSENGMILIMLMTLLWSFADNSVPSAWPTNLKTCTMTGLQM